MTNNEALARYREVEEGNCITITTHRIERLQIIGGGNVNMGDPNAGGSKIWFCNKCGQEIQAPTRKTAVKIHNA